MIKAEEQSLLKVPKTVTGTITSVQDPGQGHEKHQLAMILPYFRKYLQRISDIHYI